MPYDSFLIDGPWLVSIGWLLGKLTNRFQKDEAKNRKARWSLGIVTMFVFWFTSISLYFNKEWTRWIWEMCKAESGRDWMINSGVFNFDHENVSTRGHFIAAVFFITYPLWLAAGFKLADRKKKAVQD